MKIKKNRILFFLLFYGRTTGIEPARGGFTIHCLGPLGYVRPGKTNQLSLSMVISSRSTNSRLYVGRSDRGSKQDQRLTPNQLSNKLFGRGPLSNVY